MVCKAKTTGLAKGKASSAGWFCIASCQALACLLMGNELSDLISQPRLSQVLQLIGD
jgi:hypothetical protein